MKLSKRLSAIAHLVPQGSKVADIGTDHGMLPCYLIKQGIASFVVGADMNARPLEGAKKNSKDYAVADQISIRLGNGLEVLTEGEVEVVTISGMGGGTMVGILNNRMNIVKGLKRIIVQPNVDWTQVRQWAEEHGWHVAKEDLVFEEGRYYQVIALEPGKDEKLNIAQMMFGPKLIKDKHPLLVDYIQDEWKADKKVMDNIAKSDNEQAQVKCKAMAKQWQEIEEAIGCQFVVEK